MKSNEIKNLGNIKESFEQFEEINFLAIYDLLIRNKKIISFFCFNWVSFWRYVCIYSKENLAGRISNSY